MAYSKQIYIEPITLTDLTVNIIHNSLIIRTSTLNDFTINNDDLLEGHITYLDNNDTVEISSTGYETQIMLASEISSTIELEPINYFSKVSDGTNIYYCKDDYARNNKLDISSFNSAMKNKEDVYDQIKAPLMVTYTNGLFNPLASTLSSDGILSGTSDWNSVDISSSSINELTDYYKIIFSINRVTANASQSQVFCLEDANSEIFYLEVDGSTLYVSDNNTQYESVSLPTDQFVTVEIEHQANSSDISLSCNGTTLSSITIRDLTNDNISLISFAPVDNDVVLDISNKTYFMTIPNGEHQTFLSRNLVSESKFVADNLGNVINNQTLAASTSTQIDLSSYLPDDGAAYLVLVSAQARSGTSSGNSLFLGINTDILASNCAVFASITRTNNYTRGAGSIWMPVGAGRYINIRNGDSSNSLTNLYASLRGYIKIAS